MSITPERKTALVAEAESLANSTDWARTTARFQELQKAWQESGPAPRDAGRDLMARFRAASSTFFTRRREDLADAERFALDLVESLAVDQEFIAKDAPKLARVEFGDEHSFVTAKDLLEVLRERIEVSQVAVGHRVTRGLGGVHGGGARPVGSAPAHDQ